MTPGRSDNERLDDHRVHKCDRDQDDDDRESATDVAVSHNTTPPPKELKADRRAAKKAAKVTKSRGKALKNQAKHHISVSAADVGEIHKTLHDDTLDGLVTHPQASDKTSDEVVCRAQRHMSRFEDRRKQLMGSTTDPTEARL